MNETVTSRSKIPSRRRIVRKILVAKFGYTANEPLIPFANSLSDLHRVIVLGLVPVEAGKSLSEAASQAQELRIRLQQAVNDFGGRLRPKIIASHKPEYEVAAFAAEQDVDLMLLHWVNEPGASQAVTEATLKHAPCNVALLAGPKPKAKGKILVVLRVGADSELALRLGLILVRSGEYTITTLRLESKTDIEQDADTYSGLEQVLDHLPQVEDAVLLADDPLKAVLEQVEHFDFVIIGASSLDGEADSLFDDYARSLLDCAPCPILVTRACQHPAQRPTPDSSGIGAISILVDKWFAENTFHANEFANLERLLAIKQSQGVTISLALPSLNEEETIGHIIATIKHALMEEFPLLDEIIVVDSHSRDRTREISRGMGVPVYIHQDVLPQYGIRQGKGEALWKSLYLTKGDIVLWIDTDIVNIHPRFVFGLIGPILQRPDLMLVKGFYLRPMRIGNSIKAGGGGRVTELTARPLLNLFYPALSGLIQPLSGEYGGRRKALEQVPFSSGYGVEIGLLIDILERYGLGAIGQVDMTKRVHHNQPLNALGKMSFAIIQTVIRKLDRRDGLHLLQDVNRSMKLIRREQRHFFLEVEEIAEHQRPPMISLPEYQTRFMVEGQE
jgi:glycosyltransferase involved in cell wall biosynthesis/nucleotide-binding universal stress UspA family protein